MPRKRSETEGIIQKLREAEVLLPSFDCPFCFEVRLAVSIRRDNSPVLIVVVIE